MKRVPLSFAIFYEVILIITSLAFPPLWIYAGINAILLIICFGKTKYENSEYFDKVIISQNPEAERYVNKILYKNNKIRLRYSYSKQLMQDGDNSKTYLLKNICKNVYTSKDIKSFILSDLKNSKNIFSIFKNFSINYEYKPANLMEYINILDNEIRFLITIFELYNIEIFDKSYNYKLNENVEKNEKSFWLNYLLFVKITLNKYFSRLIKTSSPSKLIDYNFLKISNEQVYSSLLQCFACFEELNDNQILTLKR